MPTYHVTRMETFATTYRVEAESLEQAKEAFYHGDWKDIEEMESEFRNESEDVEDIWEEPT